MVLAYLNKFRFLVIKETKIQATQLGKASFASSIPAEFAFSFFNDLKEARNNLVLKTDLQLLYLMIPHF